MLVCLRGALAPGGIFFFRLCPDFGYCCCGVAVVDGGVCGGGEVSASGCIGVRANRALRSRVPALASIGVGGGSVMVVSDRRCVAVSSRTLECVESRFGGTRYTEVLSVYSVVGNPCGLLCGGRGGLRAGRALNRRLGCAMGGFESFLDGLCGGSVVCCLSNFGSNGRRVKVVLGPALTEGRGACGIGYMGDFRGLSGSSGVGWRDY